eukprot:jgi/Chlat1/1303/Chrsp118S08657
MTISAGMAPAAAASWSTVQPIYESVWLSLKHLHAAQLHPAAVLAAYQKADPLASALVIALIVSVIVYVLSIITGNVSQVDRLWSLLPGFYVVHFTLPTLLQYLEPRLLIMLLLPLLWGARLTYNYARKGGYEWKAEDYRWEVVRKAMPWPLFQLLNITFIAPIQNYLLFALATPAYLAWRVRGRVPLNYLDAAAVLLWSACWLGEIIADQQQWSFHQAKYAAKGKASGWLAHDIQDGFLQHGLFRYSRHPNFLCEISLWWCYYLFSVAATGVWLNWTLAGAIGLTLLFQGSTDLTERISASKYPAYKRYQQITSRLLPWFPNYALEKQA